MTGKKGGGMELEGKEKGRKQDGSERKGAGQEIEKEEASRTGKRKRRKRSRM